MAGRRVRPYYGDEFDGKILQRRGNSNSNANSDGNAYCNPDSYSHAHSDAYCNSDSYAYTYSYADRNSKHYAEIHSDTATAADTTASPVGPDFAVISER